MTYWWQIISEIARAELFVSDLEQIDDRFNSKCKHRLVWVGGGGNACIKCGYRSGGVLKMLLTVQEFEATARRLGI